MLMLISKVNPFHSKPLDSSRPLLIVFSIKPRKRHKNILMPLPNKKKKKKNLFRYKHRFNHNFEYCYSLVGIKWMALNLSSVVNGLRNILFRTLWLLMTSILFRILRISRSQLKCNYLKNRKLFLNFLFHFRILYHLLNILKKKMIVIANVFPKLKTVKDLVRPLAKKHRFRTPLDNQHVKAP